MLISVNQLNHIGNIVIPKDSRKESGCLRESKAQSLHEVFLFEIPAKLGRLPKIKTKICYPVEDSNPSFQCGEWKYQDITENCPACVIYFVSKDHIKQ